MASTSEGFVFFWKSYFDHLKIKGSNFDNIMRLINHAKYKVNNMRLTNTMRLIASCACLR